MTQTDDGFFSELENTKPYLKAAFEGFAGTGKTYTMTMVAIGLYELIGSSKPVVVVDTETAFKFMKPFFVEKKIPVKHKQTRSLADLKEVHKRCRDGLSDIVLVDSITHIWEGFVQAYQRDKNKARLSFEDWGIIKPKWRQEFSDPFVRDPYHYLMTGRAGFEYEDEKDEQGRRQIVKAGIKMKVEGDTAYEPDMLVLMERFEDILTDKKNVYRQATIVKDRSTIIDGKTFKNPAFKDFLPAIERMMANPVNRQASPERDAAELLNELTAEFVKRFAAASTKEEVDAVTRDVTTRRDELGSGRDRVAAARGEALTRLTAAA